MKNNVKKTKKEIMSGLIKRKIKIRLEKVKLKMNISVNKI